MYPYPKYDVWCLQVRMELSKKTLWTDVHKAILTELYKKYLKTAWTYWAKHESVKHSWTREDWRIAFDHLQQQYCS
jgi:hypothetical protein